MKRQNLETKYRGRNLTLLLRSKMGLRWLFSSSETYKNQLANTSMTARNKLWKDKIKGRDIGGEIRANGYLSLRRVPKVEKRAKKAQKRVRSPWYQLASPPREKVAWQVIGKRKGSGTRTKISKRYGGWRQRWSRERGSAYWLNSKRKVKA